MAKGKHKETLETYCKNCMHIGTDICKNCTEVFNEETQRYLMPTKYVYNEGEPMPCRMCIYRLVSALDNPCLECIMHSSRISSTGERIYENFVPKPEEDPVPKFVDNVNHPHHYEDSTSIECIQAMTLIFGEDAVADFCACNAFKYIWRYKHKNGMEDLKKAEWYLSYLGKMQEDNEFNSGSFDPEVSNRLASLLEELLKKEQ